MTRRHTPARAAIEWPTPQLDRFADLLSDGASVADAATKLGVKPATGKTMMKRLRARLGWQAI